MRVLFKVGIFRNDKNVFELTLYKEVSESLSCLQKGDKIIIQLLGELIVWDKYYVLKNDTLVISSEFHGELDNNFYTKKLSEYGFVKDASLFF